MTNLVDLRTPDSYKAVIMKRSNFDGLLFLSVTDFVYRWMVDIFICPKPDMEKRILSGQYPLKQMAGAQS